MNRPPFEARGFFTVPDGTKLSAFLNATDSSQNDVPNIAGLANVSIAAGKIGSNVHSWVHVHPYDGDEEAQVLYIVTPSYVYEAEPGKPPIYDDAVMVTETWQELLEMNYKAQAVIAYTQFLKKRDESRQRLMERK